MRNVLSFDDVLLVPKHNNIASRGDVDLSTHVCGKKMNVPIFSANMASVTGTEMAHAMAISGGVGIVHRMCSIEQQTAMIKEAEVLPNQIGAAVGIGDDWKERAQACVKAGAGFICIDVAHGDQDRVVEVANQFLQETSLTGLIVGNVATEAAARAFVMGLPLSEMSRVALKVGVGGGCFAEGTRVLLSNGTYKNIELIDTGDRVINKYGYPVAVKKAWKTGYKKLARLRTNLFYEETLVTPDHRYWTGDLSTVSKSSLDAQGYKKVLSKTRRGGKSKFGWKPIREGSSDALMLPRQIKFELESTFSVPLTKRTGGNGHTNVSRSVDCTMEPSYDLGYIFGLFLGDGHSQVTEYKKSKRGCVHWYLGAEEDHILGKLESAVTNVLGKSLSVTRPKNIIHGILYYKPLADFLLSFGKGQGKHLPSHLLVDSPEYLRGILEGLLDSDGCASDATRMSFYNTSPQLIELFNVVHYLVHGYFPNNRREESKVGTLKGINSDNLAPAYQARTLGRPEWRLLDYNQIVKVLDYSETELYAPVYDIEVDCPTHSFIANNATVHNSVCTTRIRTGFGLPTLQSVLDIATALDGYDSPMTVIADGGIKNSGDIVKCLAAGAHAVMLGSLLAGTDEAPGDVVRHKEGLSKLYAGSASHGAKKKFFGKAEYVEGAERLVPYKGPVHKVVRSLTDGIRSGFTYAGSHNLLTFQTKAEFVRITPAGYRESLPHGLF